MHDIVPKATILPSEIEALQEHIVKGSKRRNTMRGGRWKRRARNVCILSLPSQITNILRRCWNWKTVLRGLAREVNQMTSKGPF